MPGSTSPRKSSNDASITGGSSLSSYSLASRMTTRAKNRRQLAFNCTIRPRAEEGIDDDGAFFEPALQLFEIGIVGGMAGGDVERSQPGEVLLVIVLRIGAALPQVDADGNACLVKITGADESIAAIVAGADEEETG